MEKTFVIDFYCPCKRCEPVRYINASALPLLEAGRKKNIVSCGSCGGKDFRDPVNNFKFTEVQYDLIKKARDEHEKNLELGRIQKALNQKGVLSALVQANLDTDVINEKQKNVYNRRAREMDLLDKKSSTDTAKTPFESIVIMCNIFSFLSFKEILKVSCVKRSMRYDVFFRIDPKKIKINLDSFIKISIPKSIDRLWNYEMDIHHLDFMIFIAQNASLLSKKNGEIKRTFVQKKFLELIDNEEKTEEEFSNKKISYFFQPTTTKIILKNKDLYYNGNFDFHFPCISSETNGGKYFETQNFFDSGPHGTERTTSVILDFKYLVYHNNEQFIQTIFERESTDPNYQKNFFKNCFSKLCLVYESYKNLFIEDSVFIERFYIWKKFVNHITAEKNLLKKVLEIFECGNKNNNELKKDAGVQTN